MFELTSWPVYSHEYHAQHPVTQGTPLSGEARVFRMQAASHKL